MFDDLRAAFRPRLNRALWVLVVGTPVIIAGMFLGGMGAHGPDYLETIAIILVLPALLGYWVPVPDGIMALVFLFVLTLFYYYTIISLVSYCFLKLASWKRK